MVRHHDQSSLGQQRLIERVLHITAHHQRKSAHRLEQGRNLEAGADAEAMEGAAYWLTSYGLLSMLSCKTQGRQPRDGITHNELGSPLLIIN